MTSVSSRPVARLSSPGDVVATVPLLCGFRPQDSLVLLSLRGPRRRLGLTIRLDLPPPSRAADVAAALVERVVQDGGAAAVLVVYAEQPDPRLAEAVQAACAVAGVRVVQALHVAEDRWTSYVCSGPCCPAEGTPLGEAPSLVQAEHALAGRAVLPSRDDLVRALAAPTFPAAGLAGAWRARRGAARGERLAACRAALEQVTAGQVLADEDAVAVAVALHDVQVRDEVATWALDEALLALAEQVARRVGPPYDAPVCTLCAWVAYSRGDGARANVALERALRGDPEYSLALLLQQALDGALPPAQVRELLTATARALRG